jgi:acyl carrier protein
MNRTDLSNVVRDLLEKETGETYADIDDATTLREGLNLDSLDMAGLVLHIEGHFDIQIETELLDSIATVGDMLDVLERKLAAKAGKHAA